MKAEKLHQLYLEAASFPQVTKPSLWVFRRCCCFTKNSPTKGQWVELKQNAFSLVTSCVFWYLAANLCASSVSFPSLWYQAFQVSPEEEDRADLPGAEAEGSAVPSAGAFHARFLRDNYQTMARLGQVLWWKTWSQSRLSRIDQGCVPECKWFFTLCLFLFKNQNQMNNSAF